MRGLCTTSPIEVGAINTFRVDAQFKRNSGLAELNVRLEGALSDGLTFE